MREAKLQEISGTIRQRALELAARADLLVEQGRDAGGRDVLIDLMQDAESGVRFWVDELIREVRK